MGPGGNRLAYLETTYSKDDIGPNGVPLPPASGKPAAGQHPANSPTPPAAIPDDPIMDFRSRMRSAPDPARPAPVREEKPVSPETTEALIRAVEKVHRVVNDRIKYHEREAARLRASLAPFAGLASHEGPPSSQPTSADAINALTEFVKSLPDVPEAS